MDSGFWDDKRPKGVPAEASVLPFQSLTELIDDSFSRYSDCPAFTGIGHTLNYKDIDRLSAQFAAWLQNHTDLKPGDRIAIQLPNLLQYPVAAYGALRAGLVIVNTNPLYTARELHHQLNDSGARALVFLENFGSTVEEVVGDTPVEYLIRTAFADLVPAPKRWIVNGLVRHVKKMVPHFDLPKAVHFRGVLAKGSKSAAYSPVARTRDDIAVLQYTGGTTGVAKGAMITHGNLLSNLEQTDACLGQVRDDGTPWLENGKETAVAPLPLYHIYAFIVNLMFFPHTGQHSILVANPRDIGLFIKAIKNYKFTFFSGLNTLFVGLMNHPDFKQLDFSHLKVTLSGGTALLEETARRWEEMTGTRVSEGYGLTECSPVVSVNPLGEAAKPGTAGMPVPSTEIRFVGADGNDVARGEPGELCVRGPQVMKGYWRRAEATAEVLDSEGWLKTGDIAVLGEDGYIRIVDRIKDMILVSGFNVYPNEIENVVANHPGVANCACIGIPDEKTGEAPRLYVIPRNTTLSEEDVISWCRERLTAYKVPRQVVFRKELPVTPVGKVLRKELKAEFQREQASS
ncbi:AMP-binding protein [Parendozoicomonas haliclonae]|uniref:Long-chain-fatty-acid--CoA ligase n=1 Tax=Parendozoicomonas haliclonae TaxID=1960125 RepID=A0A1X7AE32_9GAMM|nr:AMP-binding protein [Parendozoicomonas haliclonae]SMA31936.1 Long-chain-fatty-acid-CoA ligase [Parendozoicomonas haliclonae]